MIFVLSGFCSLGLTRPAFFIPHFTAKSTNTTFAQELDHEFRIKDFLPFAPEHFQKVFDIPPPAPREIGQQGYIAYQWSDGELLLETSEKLRKRLHFRLRSTDAIPLQNSPFFCLEASLFLDDREMFETSSKAAASAFASRSRSEAWRAVEDGVAVNKTWDEAR